MYILKSESEDAYFNIALEEYILNNFTDDFFIIAINEPSIIIGQNQNTYDEINALYVKQNSVKVVRRLSGGGAVFQDRGNLNFSNIYTNDGSALIDFTKVSDIITSFLKDKFDLDTHFSGRNDLVLDGKKISGQARSLQGNKILHHGTLLLSSNKKSLTDALRFNPEKYADRSLRSNHDRVTNISEHLTENISMEKFKDLFVNYVRSCFPEAKMMELTHEDIANVNLLIAEKYSTWEWNYGTEPVFNVKNELYSKTGSVNLHLFVENEIIKSVKICGDFFSQRSIKDIEIALIGIPHNKKAVKAVINKFDLNCYMEGIPADELIELFFKA
jgi:lipoate---protein ligase